MRVKWGRRVRPTPKRGWVEVRLSPSTSTVLYVVVPPPLRAHDPLLALLTKGFPTWGAGVTLTIPGYGTTK
eukprot:275394-Heterocapsa_arctica.AAC.1